MIHLWQSILMRRFCCWILNVLFSVCDWQRRDGIDQWRCAVYRNTWYLCHTRLATHLKVSTFFHTIKNNALRHRKKKTDKKKVWKFIQNRNEFHRNQTMNRVFLKPCWNYPNKFNKYTKTLIFFEWFLLISLNRSRFYSILWRRRSCMCSKWVMNWKTIWNQNWQIKPKK